MCASVNRNKPAQKRPGSSRNVSRKSSIPSSARSAKSARSNHGDELHKLLHERPRPIANFQVPTVEHKKDLHAPHLSSKTHLVAKSALEAKGMDHKKTNEKDKNALKKVKKTEKKGFFNRLFRSFRSLFA